MAYNIIKRVGIGQSSETVTKNINDSIDGLSTHVPLILTNAQRLDLALELKVPNRLVYDTDLGKWYQWRLSAGNVYAWQEVNFNSNYNLYNIQTRVWNFTLPTSLTGVDLDESILPINADRETLMVILDGTVLTEGIDYTLVGSRVNCKSGGAWFAGQEMSFVVFYAANSLDDDILSDLREEINTLDNKVNNTEEVLSKAEDKIENMISGETPVAKAEIAYSLFSKNPIVVGDEQDGIFGSRVTATNNVEIESTSAEYTEVKGFSVKQVLENSYDEKLTTITPIKSIEGRNSLKQLLPKNYISSPSSAGITITKNNDGTYILNGTATSNVNFNGTIPFSNKNAKLLLRGCPAGGSSSTYKMIVQLFNNGEWVTTLTPEDTGNGAVVNTGDRTFTHIGVEIYIYNGVTLNNLIFTPQIYNLTEIFGEGNEPTLEQFNQMYPNLTYFEGIQCSKPTQFTIKSSNMLDDNNWYPILVFDTSYPTKTSPIALSNTDKYATIFMNLGVGTYTLSCKSGYYFAVNRLLKNGSPAQAISGNNNFPYTFTVEQNGLVGISVERNASATSTSDIVIGENSKPSDFEFQLSYGSAALPYQPYHSTTINLTLPYSYGMPKLPSGIGDEWLPNKYIKRVGRVDLGTLNWQKNTLLDVNYFLTSINSLTGNIYLFGANMMCSKYTVRSGISLENIPDLTIWSDYFALSNDNLIIRDDSFTSASDFKASLSGNYLYYILYTPIIDTTKTYTPQIQTFDNGYVSIDSGVLNTQPLYQHYCYTGQEYFVSCELTNKTNAKIVNSSGTQVASLSNGYNKFTASADGYYYISYIKDGINKISKAQWFPLTEMGLTGRTTNEYKQLFSDFYPFGITNAKPYKITSEEDNLLDWEYFYNTLKAVDSENINIVTKDGRRCIKITNCATYYNKGIELYKGKFSSGVSYKFSSEIFNTTEKSSLGFVMYDKYYDGTFEDILVSYDSIGNWVISNTYSNPSKIIDHIGCSYGRNDPTTYINIDKFQITHANNPITDFVPYESHEITIPQVYNSWGMVRLGNGLADELMLSKGVGMLRVGRKIFDGTENGWNVNYPISLTSEHILFYYNLGIEGIEVYVEETNTIISNLFKQKDIRDLKDEGICNYNENTFYLSIRKDKLTSLDVNGLKTYLQNNPLIMYYKLKEPQPVTFNKQDNSMIVHNYGRENIYDNNGKLVLCDVIAKYYPNTVAQTETNNQLIQQIFRSLANAGITIVP